jgi:hypothetical protein
MEELDGQEKRCKGCGRPVTGGIEKQPGKDEDVYCGQCMIDRAERYIKDAPIEKLKSQRFRETVAWKVAMILIFLICFGIIAYQVPGIISATKEPKPIRMGSYETDEVTDNCIKNLWQIAYLIQQGQLGDAQGIVCPATGKPYVIIQEPNTEAHCPNPGAHGFRDILVTKKTPVPEVRP